MNLEPLKKLGIDVRVGDIRFTSDWENFPAVDWVLDCAAIPSVLAGIEGRTSSKELLDHNLLGTINTLEYCRKHQAGFILLSTSRVYSIPPLAALSVEVVEGAYRPIADNAPAQLSEYGISESFSTEPPVSLYGSSKRCSELLALEYGMAFGFPVRINRCGVLSGAGQFGKADQGIFSYWIHSWAQRRSLQYIGFDVLGHQVRDCLHPRDMVSLLTAQMNDPSRKVAPILNVSGGLPSAMSLAQLSAWCGKRFGLHTVNSNEQPRPYDIPWMVLDSSDVKKAWGWSSMTSMEEILEEIASHAERFPAWLDWIS